MADLSLDTRALHPLISPLGSGGTGLLGTESSWLSEGSPSEKSEWALSYPPPPPPPLLQMQSAHMAHLHLWGRFRLKSSQRFRLYDKSRSRLSWRERAGAFASLPPDNSFIRLKERFAAAQALPLTWASHFPHCLWAPRLSLQTIWSVWASHTGFQEKQACWEALGASQRPARKIAGAILPQSEISPCPERQTARDQRGLNSEKQCVGLRGKEKSTLARRQRREEPLDVCPSHRRQPAVPDL